MFRLLGLLASGLVLVGLAAEARATAPLTVVIDAGHGGSNAGAKGRGTAIYEKNLTLAIARLLEKRLLLAGHNVVLTRGRDRYLTLRQRSRIAEEAKADLFVSIHANASPQHNQRGIETYFLAREAADVEARRAAARVTLPALALITEVGRLETQRASARLGKLVQKRLAEARPTQNRGVRQGAYDVLGELSVPAILVEVGFIDHALEGPELQQPEIQRAIAMAIAQGVLDYAGSDRRVAQRTAETPASTRQQN
jgi:N-acetylmuramoyl-L-alanine amidase